MITDVITYNSQLIVLAACIVSVEKEMLLSVCLLQQHNLVPATPLVSARVLREDVDCWMEVQVVCCSLFLSRRDAVVINRLRIGHTRLTHLHLLTATCQFCNLPLTVNHMLLECANLNTIRQRFFRVSSLKDLFDSIDSQIIIDFIKEIHLYALV